MSTRDIAYSIVDCMNDEQLAGFIMMFGNLVDAGNSPNSETRKILDDVKDGRNLSRKFDSVDELWEDLNA